MREHNQQQCPDCGEWYNLSHSSDPAEFDQEAQAEHELFCVWQLDENRVAALKDERRSGDE